MPNSSNPREENKRISIATDQQRRSPRLNQVKDMEFKGSIAEEVATKTLCGVSDAWVCKVQGKKGEYLSADSTTSKPLRSGAVGSVCVTK